MEFPRSSVPTRCMVKSSPLEVAEKSVMVLARATDARIARPSKNVHGLILFHGSLSVNSKAAQFGDHAAHPDAKTADHAQGAGGRVAVTRFSPSISVRAWSAGIGARNIGCLPVTALPAQFL